MLISGLNSEDSFNSLIAYNGPVFFFRYLFFILGSFYLLDQNPKLIKFFLYVSLAVITFVVVDGFIQWKTGFNLLGYAQFSNRITGIFKEEEILGHFLAHFAPIIFALMLFIFDLKKRQITWMMIFLIITEVCIFITNDRAGFLKVFQFTLLLVFLSNHFKIYRLISFCISMILVIFILSTSTHSITRYSDTLTDVQSTNIPYMPWTPGHEKHFELALNFFKLKPIFGNGPQYFKSTCIKEPMISGCTNHPHNYYFQTIAELGLVGLSFLSCAFFYLLFILIRQFLNVWFLKKKTYYIPDHLVSMYSVTFLFLWPLIPNFSFYNNWLNVLIFLPLPFILHFRKILKLGSHT